MQIQPRSSRLAHVLPDHKGARRPDVDGTEMLQLFGELRRPERPVAADIDAPQQNDVCHVGFLLIRPQRASLVAALSIR